MKIVKRIIAGRPKNYKMTEDQFIEKELYISDLADWHKGSAMYKSVKRLVDAGATRVTVRCNPLSDRKDIFADDFYIYTGYK